MKISFPADLIRWLSSDAYVPPPLVFQLNNIARCDKIVINAELLTECVDDVYYYKFPTDTAVIIFRKFV